MDALNEEFACYLCIEKQYLHLDVSMNLMVCHMVGTCLPGMKDLNFHLEYQL